MEQPKIKVAVLVSGGGTNLQALLDAERAGQMPSCEISLVLSNKAGAYALQRAETYGVPTAVILKQDFESRAAFEAAIADTLDANGIALLILAGFLYIFSAEFTARYPKRILNVHPSLIPAFCGEGYYGLKVHECALARGVKLTGATVHFVNEIADGGEILLQKAVAVEDGDTPQTLQRRVMEQAEWCLLPKAAELVSARMRKEQSTDEYL